MKDVATMVREKRERECFGCTISELKEANSLHSWKSPESLILLSASIQSDCQELLNTAWANTRIEDSHDKVRQYLNRSKYCLNEAARLIRVNKVGA